MSAPADLRETLEVKRKWRRGFKRVIFALRASDRMLSRYEHATAEKPDLLIPIPGNDRVPCARRVWPVCRACLFVCGVATG